MDQDGISGGKIVIVYSNSCSYGLANDGLSYKVYSEFISEKLEARLINKGRSGSCNRRIFRITTRDILELRKNTKEKILVLIGVAITHRSEFWSDYNYFPNDQDGHFQSFQISSIDGNDIGSFNFFAIKKFAKSWFLLQNREAMLTDLYYDLVLLTNFLKSMDVDYRIWAAPKDWFNLEFDTQAPFVKFFIDKLSIDTSIIPLDKFNFVDYCLSLGYLPVDYDHYGIYGHPGEDGHKAFAEYLLKNYLKEYCKDYNL